MNHKPRIKTKSQIGYTLVEIMVALGIFILLGSYVVSGIRGVSKEDEVKQANLKVASLLRQARNAAFNGIIEPASSVYPTGGYGVYFDRAPEPDEMIYFADQPAADDSPANGRFDVSERLQIVKLSSKLKFILAGSGVINKMSIIFNGQNQPIVVDEETPSNIIVNKKIEIKRLDDVGTCVGTVSISADVGPMYVKEEVTGC